MKKFSIITITYNSEKYLKETLDSVAEQKHSNYEHIIWDGGSTDRTLEIAASYPNVSIHQGSDKGIADAMNKGAAFAKGEYLLFLHSDDRLTHPQSLQFVENFLRQHPDTNWVYGISRIIDENSKVIKVPAFEPFRLNKLKKYNTISHPSTFIKRELFEKSRGYNPEHRYCMDYDLWLRLSQSESPLGMPFPVSDFRTHEGSLSTREALKVADEAYQIRKYYLKGILEKFRSYRSWRRRKKEVLKG